MSDYKNRIVLVQERINKWREEEVKLIESRKIFFGNIVERLDLLTASDAGLVGMLLNFKQKILTQSDLLMRFEKEGESFLNSKKKRTKIGSTHQAPSSSTAHETTID